MLLIRMSVKWPDDLLIRLFAAEISHADESGERRDVDDGFDPLHVRSSAAWRLRSGMAALLAAGC